MFHSFSTSLVIVSLFIIHLSFFQCYAVHETSSETDEEEKKGQSEEEHPYSEDFDRLGILVEDISQELQKYRKQLDDDVEYIDNVNVKTYSSEKQKEKSSETEGSMESISTDYTNINDSPASSEDTTEHYELDKNTPILVPDPVKEFNIDKDKIQRVHKRDVGKTKEVTVYFKTDVDDKGSTHKFIYELTNDGTYKVVQFKKGNWNAAGEHVLNPELVDFDRDMLEPKVVLKVGSKSVDSVFGEKEYIPLEDDQMETEEEREGEQLFVKALEILNSPAKNNPIKFTQAWMYLLRATELQHLGASERLALAYMFGGDALRNPKHVDLSGVIKQDLVKAERLFRFLASKKVPRGHLGLGILHSIDMGVNVSEMHSILYETFSALHEESMSMMAIAYRYLEGIGVEQSCEMALSYYNRAAENVVSRHKKFSTPSEATERIRLMGESETNGNRPNEKNEGVYLDEDLLQYYQFLADKGGTHAQLVLAILYYEGGRGVQVDFAKALHYFSLAHYAGSHVATSYLGKMYSQGAGVDRNNETAFTFYLEAARKKNAMGLCGLGQAYLYGAGVKVNYATALKYFTQAAEQGNVEAQLHLGIMYYSGAGVEQKYSKAVEFFHLASRGGNLLAQYNLGVMHGAGMGVMRACHTAVQMLKLVAERGPWGGMLMEAYADFEAGRIDSALVRYLWLSELGYEVAQSNVAFILDQGLSNFFNQTESLRRALRYWNRAAAQGYVSAYLKIGDYHYYGSGTKVDYEAAADNYRLAFEQFHSAQALFNLGYIHEHALGCEKDLHLAKRYYDQAAEVSPDAALPVTLALMKLNMVSTVNMLLEGKLEDVLSTYLPDLVFPNASSSVQLIHYFGKDWDMYLVGIFSMITIFLLALRQQRVPVR